MFHKFCLWDYVSALYIRIVGSTRVEECMKSLHACSCLIKAWGFKTSSEYLIKFIHVSEVSKIMVDHMEEVISPQYVSV